ncbi:hypothetical protein [Nocardia jiangsuensis]|uniref:Uncharacterized protein n=1 Tax=Nocardia jiangsuensis TaxID=1691563 RepID=A0ABV8DXY9_9NOCA
MDEPGLDLAHTVALGSIDDEDHAAMLVVLGTAAREKFRTEVRRSRAALAALSEVTAAAPPPALRARLLDAIAPERDTAS